MFTLYLGGEVFRVSLCIVEEGFSVFTGEVFRLPTLYFERGLFRVCSIPCLQESIPCVYLILWKRGIPCFKDSILCVYLILW